MGLSRGWLCLVGSDAGSHPTRQSTMRDSKFTPNVSWSKGRKPALDRIMSPDILSWPAPVLLHKPSTTVITSPTAQRYWLSSISQAFCCKWIKVLTGATFVPSIQCPAWSTRASCLAMNVWGMIRGADSLDAFLKSSSHTAQTYLFII